mmetsp:Transcript_2115/g.6101  ORF Transcript_2115/g.6101 Transcript_2115/m.6101 type:complete len:129 (-) Transcript_2115:408-794(-)
MMNCPKGVKSDDWLAVRAAIGLFVRQVRGTDLHYHNILGNNRDGLMHVFGLAPMAYGAVMLTAGVLKFRKAPGGNKDDQLLSLNNQRFGQAGIEVGEKARDERNPEVDSAGGPRRGPPRVLNKGGLRR